MLPFDAKNFTKEIDGKKVSLYTLKSDKLTVTITNYGGIIVQMLFKEKDLVLGYDSLDKYIQSDEKYFGAIVGPVCNRIMPPKTKIDGKMVEFKKADYILHSDALLTTKVWDVKLAQPQKLILTTTLDNVNHFPGKVIYTVTYEIHNNTFKTYITAFTDKNTIINCTSHPFFNFGNGDILSHQLKINSKKYLEVNESCVSVKEADVAHTPFDFTKVKAIGAQINEKNVQLDLGKGYDHCFVVTPNTEQAVLSHDGVRMIIRSNQVGMQLYSGNWLSGFHGKYGKIYNERTAVCLETQGWPNACNIPGFPSTEVKAMHEYKSSTEYEFL